MAFRLVKNSKFPLLFNAVSTGLRLLLGIFVIKPPSSPCIRFDV